MNSPLAITALLLWTVLAILAVRVCRRWAKERNKVRTIMKNHPAIPVKEYKLSDFSAEVAISGVKPAKVLSSEKLSTEQQAQRMASLQNVWDT